MNDVESILTYVCMYVVDLQVTRHEQHPKQQNFIQRSNQKRFTTSLKIC